MNDFRYAAERHFFATSHSKGSCEDVGSITKWQTAKVFSILMISEYSQPKTSTYLHDEAFMEYNTFMGVRQISQIFKHSQVIVLIFSCKFQTLGAYGGKLCTGVLTEKCDDNGVIVLSNSYIMKAYHHLSTGHRSTW
jgi:hypothetical protein